MRIDPDLSDRLDQAKAGLKRDMGLDPTTGDIMNAALSRYLDILEGKPAPAKFGDSTKKKGK